MSILKGGIKWIAGAMTSPGPEPDEPATPTTESGERGLDSAFTTPKPNQTDVSSTISPLGSIMNIHGVSGLTEDEKRKSAYTLLVLLYKDVPIPDILKDAAKVIPMIITEEPPASLASSVCDARSRRIDPAAELVAAKFLDELLDGRKRKSSEESSKKPKRRKGNKRVIQEVFSDEEQDELFPSSIFADGIMKLIVVDPDQQVVKGGYSGVDDKSNTRLRRSI